MSVTGQLTSHDGTTLAYERWQPAATPRAQLVIVQGRGEHTGRYGAFAQACAAAGYDVWSFDVRGQGRSAGQRGHVPTLRHALQDIHACVMQARQSAHLPLVLLGHSMGGLFAIHYAVEHPAALAGLVLTSPLCGLATPVPWWEDRLACWLSGWWPTFAIRRSREDARWLSRDPKVCEQFLRDPLVHFHVTTRLYYELKHGMGRARFLAQQILTPTLIVQAGDDHIVSAQATREAFEALGAPDKTLQVYDGWYHEVLNEVDAERVVRQILDWMAAHVPVVTRR